MSVAVTRTGGCRAEIVWEPGDDPVGYLARAVEGDQLAYALEALGQPSPAAGGPEEDLAAARQTADLARLLERRAAAVVVRLRDHHGLSWRRIATVMFENAERQSSVRRMYESGRRHLGS
ncbi:hypothetical protein [Streptomyces sp. WMMB303]|uniref:hypothetical protein n=1 Tax=Streptomyces sp. WMMB303 TaxID=3034154 RepID=UPI0023EB5432|nr:hypothetical protein [Streptomyces sp. WMMB303]MDF4254599.1 hypothetical protein [Streptomyces sp. WMMB303]